ncbi:hypothetical protein ACYX78_07250 [Advenella incenata]
MVFRYSSICPAPALAPAGTPPDIVLKVNSALKQSLADPEVTRRLAVIDGEVKVSSPQAFSELITLADISTLAVATAASLIRHSESPA